MTDYVTLTINENTLNSFTEFLIWFIVILAIIMTIKLFIESIINEIEKSRKIKRDKIEEPYRRKYKKLKDEEKYQESLDYYDKYKEFLKNDTYY